MDKTIPCNGSRTNFGGFFDHTHLCGFDPIEDGFGLTDVFKSGV
jgi:hypothetical protein